MSTTTTVELPQAVLEASDLTFDQLQSLSVTSPSEISKLRRKLTVSGIRPELDGFSMIDNISDDNVIKVLDSNIPGVESFIGQTIAGYAVFNTHKANQDNYMIYIDNDTHSLIFGVLDGHGDFGHDISSYVSIHIVDILLSDENWKEDVKLAISRSITSVESRLISDNPQICQFSGTTITLSVLRDMTLYTAHIGDCRQFINGTSDDGISYISQITQEHYPAVEQERDRIVSLGGRIFGIKYGSEYGPSRVWLTKINTPGLTITRSIGDIVAQTVGVISEPEISSTSLSPNDKYIVTSSNGIYEFLSNDEVMNYIYNNQLEDALSEIITRSSAEWLSHEKLIDDMSIIIVKLRN